jgi:nitrous oxidase accessory protein
MVARNLMNLICISLIVTPLFGGVIDVCEGMPYATIMAGLEVVENGDTLRIHPGVYREGNISVDKSIFIQGIDFPIIDGEGENEALTISADSVRVEGLHIRNVGTSYTEDLAGIRMRNSRNFVIHNNLLENTFFGIYLEHVKDGIVSQNRVFGEAINEMSSGNAIHLWKCARIQVIDNHVKKHRDGIYFEFVEESVVRKNVSEDNLRYGLHFMFSNHDDYFENTFIRNGAGVAVMFSKKIQMHHNIFQQNWGNSSYGLLLKEITDATIEHNQFIENSIGIYVEGASRIKYSGNIFSSNGWAFKISGGCVDMVVSGNNFIGNTFDISINSAINNNIFSENYWSSYSGYDLDRDGIGDVPYRPVKLFNYVINQTPEAIVLLRSLFIDILNFSERINPTLTPKNVMDLKPLMHQIEL